MTRWLTLCCAVLGTGLLSVSVTNHIAVAEPSSQPDPEPAQRSITPIDLGYQRLANQFAAEQQLDFDHVFSRLCSTALANAERQAGRRLEDEIRAMFGGLWIWSRQQGQPVLQARRDLALHFIAGGAFEGYWDAGTTAALVKERADSRGSARRYDLDDLAATMLGARWMNLATAGRPDQNRRWVELWARRELTLGKSIPPLTFASGSTRTGTAEEIAKVWRAVEEMLVDQ